MPEASGRLRLVTLPLQFALPVAGADTTLMTQVLVLGALGFGIGSGGPKRQFTSEQVALLPVCAEVRAESVNAPVIELQEVIAVCVTPEAGTTAGSGTPSSPPPK